MRIHTENFSKQLCLVKHAMLPAFSHPLPSRCLKCMAMAKGFSDRSVPKTESKAVRRRREQASNELQQLQVVDLLIHARDSTAGPSQQPHQQEQGMSPEEVAPVAKIQQEEVLRLREGIRSSEFFRHVMSLLGGSGPSPRMTWWRASSKHRKRPRPCAGAFRIHCGKWNSLHLKLYLQRALVLPQVKGLR